MEKSLTAAKGRLGLEICSEQKKEVLLKMPEDFSWSKFADILGKLRFTNDEEINASRLKAFRKAIAEELALSAEECYTEVPFCYREMEGEDVVIWNGVMDVVYKKDGVWHILDDKTNLDGTGLDEKYKGQLTAYMKAFQGTTGESAEDALTYHIDI